MEYNNDFKYDLKVGQVKEEELGNIFNSAKIEVKYDLKALSKDDLYKNNVYVEFWSRGKKSGISTTQADYYCFCFGDKFHLVKTTELKDKCRVYLNTWRNREGGDNNTSRGILLPITELLR